MKVVEGNNRSKEYGLAIEPKAKQVERSAQDLMAQYQARLIEQEPKVHAWAYLPNSIVKQVVAADGGKLAGIPFGVKDVIDVQGMPTASGVEAYYPAVSTRDAACVAMLRAAGAVPVGKTVTAEYAFRQPGPTRNPHHLEHTPGGSSSGSAAAVAAGMVPFALSTQTGGSIIRPAAYCGVVGVKPSFGLVPRAGMALTCDSLDVIGWHAATLADARVVADVLLPRAPVIANSENLKIAYLDWSPLAELEKDSRLALEQARAVLTKRHDTKRTFPHSVVEQLCKAHDVIMPYEFARNVRPFLQSSLGQPSAALWQIMETGLAVSEHDYLQALALRSSLSLAWTELTDGADLLLTASVPGVAPLGLDYTGSPAFCKMWSVLGWPCVHVPTGLSNEGLPVGVQLVGPMFSDHQLLAWAQELQSFIREGQNEQ